MDLVLCVVGVCAVVAQNGRLPLSRAFHVRVMLPCYRESLDLIQATAYACIRAELPAGCYRTVYICDDGKDEGDAIHLLNCCQTDCQGVGLLCDARPTVKLYDRPWQSSCVRAGFPLCT